MKIFLAILILMNAIIAGVNGMQEDWAEAQFFLTFGVLQALVYQIVVLEER